MSIYENRLQQDLESLRERCTKQAALVTEALKNAYEATVHDDHQLAYMTVLKDAKINRWSRKIDKHCHRFIALHLPSAGHLRRISAVMRVNMQLERLGDYAVIISRQGVRLSKKLPSDVRRDLENVGEESIRMLDQAIDAFLSDNAEAARVTVDMHGHMEHALDSVYENLLASDFEPKDLVAMFVIFNLLKRIADQSKNISEQTIFAATGEIKELKRPNVLFVDSDNTGLSKMAEVVARKTHDDDGSFSSAGKNPGSAIDAQMAAFLEERGVDMSGEKTTSMDRIDLDAFDVIISVDGPVSGYVSDMPFHTSALEWQIGNAPGGGSAGQYEDIYRAITNNVGDLMRLLCGKK